MEPTHQQPQGCGAKVLTGPLLERREEDSERSDQPRGLDPRRRPDVPRNPDAIAVLVLLDELLVGGHPGQDNPEIEAALVIGG